MAKDLYDNNDNLNYKDSWLQNTVQLAALGTILGGSATLATKGDLTHALRGSKRAFGAAGKGFENYVKRNGSTASKFGMQVGKKTFLNLKRMPKPKTQSEEGQAELRAAMNQAIKKVQESPDIEEKIRQEVSRQTKNKIPRSTINDILDGKSTDANEYVTKRVRFLYEKVKSQEVKGAAGMEPVQQKKPRRKLFGDASKGENPVFDKKEVAKDMVGSGLTGLAFGAGLSGFHAIDRMSSDKDNQEKVENAFNYAGSFLPKTAGALEAYNRIKEIGRKTPEAVASGLGFTGVSLGAAKLVNDHKEKQQQKGDDKPKGTRVIIELGDTDMNDEKNLGNHPMNSLGALPKLSSTQPSGLFKSAAPDIKKFNLNAFVDHLTGHKKEIDSLKQVNPADEAANQLKNQDVSKLVKEKYGDLVNDKTEGQFRKSLFDSKADEIKVNNDNRIKDLETATAKARLQAGGGALAVGGGLAALSARKKEEKPNVDTASTAIR